MPDGAQNAERGQGLLFLLPNDVDAKLKQLTHGEFTGEQIRRDHPELFQVVVKMGELGMSLRMANQLTGLSKNTVAAIYESSDVGTAAVNARLAGRARRCLALIFDELEHRLENAAKEETKDLGILCGILLTHLTQLQGGPTLNVKVSHEAPAGFEDYLAKLKRVGSQMGLGGVDAGQMGAAAALAAGGGPGSAGARTLEVAADVETVVSDTAASDSQGDDTGCVADRGARAAGADRAPAGGEGVEGSRPGGEGGGISELRNFGQMPKAETGMDAGVGGAAVNGGDRDAVHGAKQKNGGGRADKRAPSGEAAESTGALSGSPAVPPPVPPA